MTERPILFSAPMVRAILSGAKTQTRRIVKPQPPSVEAVRAKSGSGYHLADLDASGLWRVMGPVWAVRDLMGGVRVDARSRADVGPQWRCPYGAAGDRLWVRETWCLASREHDEVGTSDGRPRSPSGECAYYAATDGDVESSEGRSPWRPSIFMPRWASRITLEVTKVRVQRLQDISAADACDEGAAAVLDASHPLHAECYAKHGTWTGDETLDVNGPFAGAVAAFATLWDSINGELGAWASNPWVWAITFKRQDGK